MKRLLLLLVLTLVSLTACALSEEETIAQETLAAESDHVFESYAFLKDATELMPSIGCQKYDGNLEAGYTIPFEENTVEVKANYLEYGNYDSDKVAVNYPAKIWVTKPNTYPRESYQITFCKRSDSDLIYYFIEESTE